MTSLRVILKTENGDEYLRLIKYQHISFSLVWLLNSDNTSAPLHDMTFPILTQYLD